MEFNNLKNNAIVVENMMNFQEDDGFCAIYFGSKYHLNIQKCIFIFLFSVLLFIYVRVYLPYINRTFADKTKYTCLINPDEILADIYLNLGYLYR